jgi:acyl-coenzyme A synthetase/AMP-(fatty) acid ligase
MASLYQHLATQARQFPERAALDDGTSCISFGDLPELIDSYRSCLLAAGVTPDSTVGLTIRHGIAHLLVTLALFRLPAHQATLASFEPESYHHNLIERLNISHLLTIDETLNPTAPRPDQFHVRKLEPTRPANSSGSAKFYSSTSGTTKGPRIIALVEENLTTRGDRQRMLAERVLITSSPEHGTIKRRHLRFLYAGCTLLFAPKANAWNALADFVSAKKATLLYISPLDANRFVQSAGDHRQVNARLFVGGTRISWSLRKAMQQKLSRALYVAYGASECGQLAVAEPHEHDERETAGKPRSPITVEIADGAGRALPPGEVGELRVRAPGMITGYHDDPVETGLRFRGGWFHPGDMGLMTKDGELIIHGRKDDMMMMNGINIYPLELERVLEGHPAVSAAAAFPVKSRLHGDIPAVAVELAAGANATEISLMQYARERLGLRYPRRILILDKLPKSGDGKILKNEIVSVIKQGV